MPQPNQGAKEKGPKDKGSKEDKSKGAKDKPPKAEGHKDEAVNKPAQGGKGVMYYLKCGCCGGGKKEDKKEANEQPMKAAKGSKTESLNPVDQEKPRRKSVEKTKLKAAADHAGKEEKKALPAKPKPVEEKKLSTTTPIPVQTGIRPPPNSPVQVSRQAHPTLLEGQPQIQITRPKSERDNSFYERRLQDLEERRRKLRIPSDYKNMEVDNRTTLSAVEPTTSPALPGLKSMARPPPAIKVVSSQQGQEPNVLSHANKMKTMGRTVDFETISTPFNFESKNTKPLIFKSSASSANIEAMPTLPDSFSMPTSLSFKPIPEVSVAARKGIPSDSVQHKDELPSSGFDCHNNKQFSNPLDLAENAKYLPAEFSLGSDYYAIDLEKCKEKDLPSALSISDVPPDISLNMESIKELNFIKNIGSPKNYFDSNVIKSMQAKRMSLPTPFDDSNGENTPSKYAMEAKRMSLPNSFNDLNDNFIPPKNNFDFNSKNVTSNYSAKSIQDKQMSLPASFNDSYSKFMPSHYEKDAKQAKRMSLPTSFNDSNSKFIPSLYETEAKQAKRMSLPTSFDDTNGKFIPSNYEKEAMQAKRMFSPDSNDKSLASMFEGETVPTKKMSSATPFVDDSNTKSMPLNYKAEAVQAKRMSFSTSLDDSDCRNVASNYAAEILQAKRMSFSTIDASNGNRFPSNYAAEAFQAKRMSVTTPLVESNGRNKTSTLEGEAIQAKRMSISIPPNDSTLPSTYIAEKVESKSMSISNSLDDSNDRNMEPTVESEEFKAKRMPFANVLDNKKPALPIEVDCADAEQELPISVDDTEIDDPSILSFSTLTRKATVVEVIQTINTDDPIYDGVIDLSDLSYDTESSDVTVTQQSDQSDHELLTQNPFHQATSPIFYRRQSSKALTQTKVIADKDGPVQVFVSCSERLTREIALRGADVMVITPSASPQHLDNEAILEHAITSAKHVIEWKDLNGNIVYLSTAEEPIKTLDQNELFLPESDEPIEMLDIE